MVFYKQDVVLRSLAYTVVNNHVCYSFCGITLDKLIGTDIEINYLNKRYCRFCSVPMKLLKYDVCFMCRRQSLFCDLCIVKPTLCHFHKGTCRQPLIASHVCFSDFSVYLSYTSGCKVGLTRSEGLEKRWIGQGAIYGLPIFTMNNRRDAGYVESDLLKFVYDKTSVYKMLSLSSNETQYDLSIKQIGDILNDIRSNYQIPDYARAIDTVEGRRLYYPIHDDVPKKKLALPHVKGKIIGAKGQYLITDAGYFNVMRHLGCLCCITLG